MSDVIQLLPDHIANQIAAGEVVQRPASVVKELLENAIDAGAGSIKLVVVDSGRTLIQVIDNGKGMSTTDARLCFERHATSKIKKADDLFNISTKGFRGEALASIAAVAQVTLKTKRESEELGTVINIEGSKITKHEPVATEKGTSIAVKNLFFNIPARRNFLKSDSVEMRHINDEFQRVALTHPDISFSMFQNQVEVFNLKKGNLRQRIVAVLGKKSNEKLVPISEEIEQATIEGYVFKPEFAKKKQPDQFFFVNNRFIKSAYLNHAVSGAYEGMIQPGCRPGYLLYLTVPQNTIDINIHPTKTEIKFEDEHTLYAVIRAAVKHSLGLYNVAPVLDFDKDPALEVPYSYKSKLPNNPRINVDPTFNPFKNEQQSQRQKSFHNVGYSPSANKLSQQEKSNWESMYAEIKASAADLEKSQPKQASLDFEIARDFKPFQIHQKYMVAELKNGLMYVHQNRAQQRIIYEQLLKRITHDETMSQQLLFPKEIHLQKTDIQIIKDLTVDIERIGFTFGNFYDESVELVGIPVNMEESLSQEFFEDVVANAKQDIPQGIENVEIIAKRLAFSMAIKTGAKLSTEEQEKLLKQLFECEEPSIDPSGKKTFIPISMKEIDHLFN